LKKTHVPIFPDENRQQLVNAGAIPVLVSLLNSPNTDVQYYCTATLSNIAVDGPSAPSYCLGAMTVFTDQVKLAFLRLKPEKIGTK